MSKIVVYFYWKVEFISRQLGHPCYGLSVHVPQNSYVKIRNVLFVEMEPLGGD